MNLMDYLDHADMLHSEGYKSDGISVIGWFVHRLWKGSELAGYAHDYARTKRSDGTLLIPVRNQHENDRLFKQALEYFGVPWWVRGPVYLMVRWQGSWSERYGIDASQFILIMIILILILRSFVS